MMTAAQFHKRKAIGRSQHKNPIAQDIYTLLLAYEDPQSTPNRKLKLLVLIYFLCLEYVWGKNGPKKKFDPLKHKDNLVVRLMYEIEAEVQTATVQTQYARMVGGEHYKGGVQQAAPHAGKSLSGQYGVEKLAPRDNVVGKYRLNTTIPAFGMSLLTQVIESKHQLAGNNNWAQAAHQEIANMSLIDLFKTLHGMWHDTNLKNMNFTFFNSVQRQPYAATYSNGMWSCNGMTPYTTGMSWGQLNQVMYVMDTSERLFIADGIRTGGGEFNHSSMLSGAPCICAGTLKIDQTGKLVYIDNDSGHYKPGTNDLKQAAHVLVNGFRIPAFGVQVHDKVTGQTKNLLQMLH